MKIKICLYPIMFTGSIFLFIMANSCKKDNPSVPTIPVLTTNVISKTTLTSTVCGGNITSDGGATVTSRGVCWSNDHTPTIVDNITKDGLGKGGFTTNISGLVPNTTYYIRAYATNSKGTSYGNTMILKTYTGTVADIDGNVYYTVSIGSQIWMAQNLKVIHYCNGDAIPNETNIINWQYLSSGAYCDNNYDTITSTVYGRLYNWYAVIDSRKIAPNGWHIPSDAEWTTLINFLGGESIAGDKLKEAGKVHWVDFLGGSNNGTNESGFTALPGGYLSSDFIDYHFDIIGHDSFFWSTTSDNNYISCAETRYLNYDSSEVDRTYKYKVDGFSLRCVKD